METEPKTETTTKPHQFIRIDVDVTGPGRPRYCENHADEGMTLYQLTNYISCEQGNFAPGARERVENAKRAAGLMRQYDGLDAIVSGPDFEVPEVRIRLMPDGTRPAMVHTDVFPRGIAPAEYVKWLAEQEAKQQTANPETTARALRIREAVKALSTETSQTAKP